MKLIFFGMFGLFLEIIFTSFRNLICNKDVSLIGHTSLWMFPVYAIGLTFGLDFIRSLILTDVIRWASYPIWVWTVEIIFGSLLLIFGTRAWDYHYLQDKFHWRGLISYVHAPVWIMFGLMVETIDGKLF